MHAGTPMRALRKRRSISQAMMYSPHLIVPALDPRPLPTSPAMVTTRVLALHLRQHRSNFTTNTATISQDRIISYVPRSSSPTFMHGARLATPNISTMLPVPFRVSKSTSRLRSRMPVSTMSTTWPRPRIMTWRVSGSERCSSTCTCSFCEELSRSQIDLHALPDRYLTFDDPKRISLDKCACTRVLV